MNPAKIQVRFSDLDVMGHVNNAVYLSYFEMARIHYFNKLLGSSWDWKINGVLLRTNEIEYLHPVFITDVPEIKLYTKHVGTKSFTLGYDLSVNNKLCSTGSSVLVCFNSETNSSIVIPEKLKEALSTLIPE
jgi:acyl-CoA thioester hydrolase